MKKVLIISYYWLPSGGAGVQRWVKFAKYLPACNWEPIIYTPSNPEYPSLDYSFEKDIPATTRILKTPIWEPYNVYRKFAGKKNEPINAGFISENSKSGWKDKLSIWLRGNFLIPDPRRFWIAPSVRYLTEYIQNNPVDAIISTGPPHSMHMIGLGLKKVFPQLPWIADFRDPWTNIDFYRDLNLSPVADIIHHRMEKKVVRTADCVLVVSNGMKEEYKLLQPRNIQLISNGYDLSDIPAEPLEMDSKFSISHIGTLNAARNPHTLWKVLSELCAANSEFRDNLSIQLVGKVDFTVMESITDLGLKDQLIKINYLSHDEAIAKQSTSQLLLLLINQSNNARGILTGKFFEYLAARRPVLAIGPTDGDVAEILEATRAGKIVDFDDEAATRRAILHFYELYRSGQLSNNSAAIEAYSRQNLTVRLSELLNAL